MKDILVKNMGITDFAIGSPREVLKAAYANKLIDNDEWLVMLKARKQLAHDYDGEYAKEKRAHYKKIKGAENMRKRYEKLRVLFCFC